MKFFSIKIFVSKVPNIRKIKPKLLYLIIKKLRVYEELLKTNI